jgi:hypothetical protein
VEDGHRSEACLADTPLAESIVLFVRHLLVVQVAYALTLVVALDYVLHTHDAVHQPSHGPHPREQKTAPQNGAVIAMWSGK